MILYAKEDHEPLHVHFMKKGYRKQKQSDKNCWYCIQTINIFSAVYIHPIKERWCYTHVLTGFRNFPDTVVLNDLEL